MAIVFLNHNEDETKAFWESLIGPEVRVNRRNRFFYSIVNQLFWGKFGGAEFGPYPAPSGGGQDGLGKSSMPFNKVHPGVRASYANRAAINTENRGGAIPPGIWAIEGEILKRNQMSANSMWGGAPTNDSLRLWPLIIRKRYANAARHSFYIHGTGGKGSDGCILLPHHIRADFARRISQNGGALLRVFLNGMELNEAFSDSDVLNRTA